MIDVGTRVRVVNYPGNEAEVNGAEGVVGSYYPELLFYRVALDDFPSILPIDGWLFTEGELEVIA